MAKNNGSKPEESNIQPTLTDAQISKLVSDAEENPIAKAFTSESGFNAAKAMVELKEELGENALLLDIPDKRFVVAVKYAYYQYKKHGCDERIKALMIQLGLLASVKGKRVETFKEAIIGERGNYPFAKNDWQDRVKNFAFGDKNK
ncbi:hypothetical protein M0R72_21650 [Candidatus Pacearchaeota archaeon]|jgi:hypothetical protein|nr:hypothetical protein [Candidatus Pacearchaeota archaeon]